MFYVYLIRSIHYPEQIYVGITQNLNQRIKTHNSGGAIYTSKYKPWDLVTYVGFKNGIKAHAFEKYLKSGSGRAFAKKRLW